MLAKAGEEVHVKTLTVKKCGRPLLLGIKLDKYLQQLIAVMLSRGTPTGTKHSHYHWTSNTTKAQEVTLEENGGAIKLNKEWARSVLICMG